MSEVESMKNIRNFLKVYGFYIAISIICIGAIVAIFVSPNKEGNIGHEANPYTKNELTQGADLQDVNKPNTDKPNNLQEEGEDLNSIDEGIIPPEASEIKEENAQKLQENEKVDQAEGKVSEPSKEEVSKEEVIQDKASTDEIAEEDQKTPEVKTETFESTTASISEDPFFVEGDQLEWPVEGEVVVPYTDDSTTHWYSDSLNQTMRTFGICISGEEGAEVKAVARGTVTDIIEDSTTYLPAGMPYVGKLMIVDLGNGYKCLYGFQGGTPDEKLVGQVVNVGDVLGTVGSPKGAFINQGDNIYLQIMHNDEVINPLNLLGEKQDGVKEDGVDLGFAK